LSGAELTFVGDASGFNIAGPAFGCAEPRPFTVPGSFKVPVFFRGGWGPAAGGRLRDGAGGGVRRVRSRRNSGSKVRFNAFS